MKDRDILQNDERVIFGLREIYGRYGYSQYKMNKFEEYDLYVRNKDFLVSDNVITFTDTNGKLMALKPDVTLSIIKNADDEPTSLQKVFYNENVYRVSGSTRAFREIMQVGLECVGAVDTYAICEVLSLAAKSLSYISEDCLLDISDLDVVSQTIDSLGVTPSAKAELLKCVGEKNLHGINAICESENADSTAADLLCTLVSTYGPVSEVLPTLQKISADYPKITALSEFIEICNTLDCFEIKDKMNVDFSVINDMNYYNGVVFKGFVKGIPSGILSGGQYGRLMKKLGKRSKAIGFAVYMDMLDELASDESEFDVDTILLYGDKADARAVKKAVDELIKEGKSVSVQKCVPEKLRAREILKLSDGEVIKI